ncbi:MAG TPA: alpha/beta hydrolase [Gemmatimonadales bacterium]|nr:alpha/beta hydrolase [Gemmatimonadales bacterium]
MSENWKVRLVRAALRTTQSISTEAAGWLADRVFCTPPASSVPNSARPVLAAAQRSWVTVDGRRVAVWRWGRGPAVALVHGWGSRAARLAVFVEPLVASGFSVVAFDAPGHGESDGLHASGVQAARALRAVAAATPLYGVVAHSLGVAATVIALGDGLDLRRAVFIAPPSELAEYAHRFATQFGLKPRTLEAMMRRTEKRLRFSWDNLDLAVHASVLSGVDILLFHDKDDPDVPWNNGARLAAAWPRATLITTEGLGHHRIARDPRIVAHAARFMKLGIERLGGDASREWLDQELFERERRQRLVGVRP